MARKSSEIPFSPPQPEMDAKIDEVRESNEPFIKPLLAELQRLEEQVREMQIASRFNPSITLTQDRAYANLNPLFEGKTEPEAKRLELLMKINNIRQDLLSLTTNLEDLKMEIHVTGEEM